MTLDYCAKLQAIRYESTSLNRIVANKSHRVIVALQATTPYPGHVVEVTFRSLYNVYDYSLTEHSENKYVT